MFEGVVSVVPPWLLQPMAVLVPPLLLLGVVRSSQGVVAEADHHHRRSPPSRGPPPLGARGVWTGLELVAEAALAAGYHSSPKQRESVAGVAQHGSPTAPWARCRPLTPIDDWAAAQPHPRLPKALRACSTTCLQIDGVQQASP